MFCFYLSYASIQTHKYYMGSECLQLCLPMNKLFFPFYFLSLLRIMSDNIEKLMSSGKQKFLNYCNVYEVQTRPILFGQSILTTQQEHSKVGFNYPSYRMFDNQNAIEKSNVHQQKQTLEFKLTIDSNCIVTQFFFFIQYRNLNSKYRYY